MDNKDIQELVQNTVNNAFKEIEVSNIRKEVEDLRASNKELVNKLAEKEEASIPEEKVNEITEVVEKAISDKVDSIVGDALKKAIDEAEKVEGEEPEVKEELEVKEEIESEEPKSEEEVVEEEAMTNRQRIKEALLSRRRKALGKKKVAKSNAFKPMSRQSIAYTNCSEATDDELEALTETLKKAKTKQEVEEVKKLLQAFISSAKKVNVSEDLEKEIDDDLAELDAYRALGTVDEIEAAVEVIETYADEIGSLPELKEDEKTEVKEEVKEEVKFGEELSARKQALRARRRALASRRKALASKKKSLAFTKRAQLSAKREAILKARKEALASKKAESKKAILASRRAEALKARKEALASRKEEAKKQEMSTASRIQRIKELKEKRVRLASLKEKIKQNISTSSTVGKNVPGAMASALFAKRG